MKALITGASSGLGADFARILSAKGYDLILVARRKKKMETLAKKLKTNVEILEYDLSSTYNCMLLYEKVKKEKIDILINNAGFGLFGKFDETKLDIELDMIDLNIKAVHILTKSFLKDFKKRDSGYILNVASAAAFLPGPLMSTYYATKAYILHLTLAISEELKKDSSNVYIGALCPGPVDTEFNKVAKVKFNLDSLSSEYTTKYAIKEMFKRKTIIIPGIKTRMGIYMSKALPMELKLGISYKLQRSKNEK